MRSFVPVILALSLMAACKGPEGPEGPAGVDGEDGLDGQSVLSIDEDTTWDTDTEIAGTWLVRDGVTLTIEQGVTVTVLPGAGLIVEGTLATNGSGNGIDFEALSSISSNLGVTVLGSATGLDGASFTGLDLSLEGNGTPTLSDVVFTDSTLWVMERTTPFSLSGATFNGTYTGAHPAIVAEVDTEITVSEASIEGGVQGIEFVGTGAGASLVVSDSSLRQLDQGITGTGLTTLPNDVTLTNVGMSNISGSALDLRRIHATLTDVNITLTDGTAIAGSANSKVTMVGGSIIDAGGSCIGLSGSATLDSVQIEGCGGTGVLVGRDGGSLTDVVVRDTYSSGIVSDQGDLVLERVEIYDARNLGVYVDYGSLTATDLVVEDSEQDSVRVTHGSIDLTGFTSRRSGQRAVLVSASTGSLSDVIIEDVVDQGITVDQSTVTLSDISVTAAGSYGLMFDVAEASLDGITVVDTIGGIWARLTDVTAADVSVDTSFFSGVQTYGGVVTFTDTTVTASQSHGLQGSFSALNLTDVTITDAGERGISATGGPLTLERVTITDTGERGIYSDRAFTLTDTSVQRTGDTGIQAPDVTMDYSEILDAGYRGMLLTAGEATTITNSDVRNSAYHGLQGVIADNVSMEISGCNFVDNAVWAMYGVGNLDGNYIAGNLGMDGADLTADAGEEGSQEVTTDQVRNAASITNPASAEIEGTGPR